MAGYKVSHIKAERAEGSRSWLELPKLDVLKVKFQEIIQGGRETVWRLSTKLQNPTLVGVSTAYKRKAQKVRPVDDSTPSKSKPGGLGNWKEVLLQQVQPNVTTGRFDHWLYPRFCVLERGARLTPERKKALIIGPDLTPQEKDLFIEMLHYREAALAFEFSHCGRIREEVAPPQIIKTIEHKAWQAPGFPVPKALNSVIAEMLRERIKAGVLEYCDGPYRNPYFLVKKREGKYRLINNAIEINRVTVRDAGLPPSPDEFAEDFAGLAVSSLIDFFSGYDQITLAEESRNLTAFSTTLGLLRMTTLPQGATNSVAQFMRIITKVLEELIPTICRPFLDDIGVKGPRTRYSDQEVAPGIRRFMLEHIQNLDKVLLAIELAGGTIGPKSQWCMNGVAIVGYICGSEGRSPESSKVIKVLDWPPCTGVTAARAFIGLCVYYRIWIPRFALIASPIYELFRKDAEFAWGEEQQLAMDSLKLALTTAPALVQINYEEGAGKVVLAVDASLTGWGAVLMQEDEEKKRHPSRYESGMWNHAEQNYDATKRECRGVLKALKKVRYWLYGIQFVLETDANVLVAQLNRSGTDLPGSLLTRWLAWIRLFDFEVKHVPGKKHTAADGLSRRSRTESDRIDEENEVDIDEFIQVELNSLKISPIAARVEDASERDFAAPGHEILEGDYNEQSHQIARFLTTFERPADMTTKEYRLFKAKALRYQVQNKELFRRAGKRTPQTRVIDSEDLRNEVIRRLHDEMGHKGRESTYRRVADRYYWETCYKDVKAYCKSCEECQRRQDRLQEEPLYPTWTTALWTKIGLDVVHMPPCQGKHYLVVARCDFSGWVEARALTAATSEAVARFLWEDVVCRHGIFGKVVLDGGPENRKHTEYFTQKYGIKRVLASAYHPQGNGMIERGHKPITDALSKMTSGGIQPWVPLLHAVLFADRVSTRVSTGQSPFYLSYGSEAILPVEMDISTWRILDWEGVESRADLLALRARQFLRRDQDLEEAALHLQRKRMNGQEAFDGTRQLRRGDSIQQGSLVLLHDRRQDVDMSKASKLGFRWLGPYRVSEANRDKGFYKLEEMDGTQLSGTFAGNRLKVFIRRQGFYEEEVSDSVEDSEVEGRGAHERIGREEARSPDRQSRDLMSRGSMPDDLGFPHPGLGNQNAEREVYDGGNDYINNRTDELPLDLNRQGAPINERRDESLPRRNPPRIIHFPRTTPAGNEGNEAYIPEGQDFAVVI